MITKTILITGATDGIGKITAIKLASDGHELLLHGRSNEKLENVISEIKELTNNKTIHGFIADLSDFESVKKMGSAIQNTTTKIDILINNAGVFNSVNSHNTQGYDMRFVVNYLSPYLLSKELAPLLQKVSNARIINLSSAAQSTVSIDALKGAKKLSENNGYAQSKLALTMWSFHLAKQLENIQVIPVNPGSLLNTKMVREAFGHSWSSADKGAQILYELAISENYKGITGKYFDNDKGSFSLAHSDAYDKEKINSLIQATEEILALV